MGRTRFPMLPGLPSPSWSRLFFFGRYLELRAVSRWVGLGLVVGILAGLAACLLYVGVESVAHLVQHTWARAELLEPAGERGLFSSAPPEGPTRSWVLILAPAVGGFLSALLVHYFCREARGGNEGWLAAFHTGGGWIRKRVAPVKLLAAAINLGAGASGGREGPIAHIGAALGSFVARVLRLNDRERRLLLVAGAAGGIGAIFRTPLGGALFVVEVLYSDDLEVDAIVPAVLSSVVAYSLFTSLFGEGHLFATAGKYQFDARQLPLFFAMAIGAGVVGVAFVELHHKFESWFERTKLWFPLRSLLGGLLVGLLILVHPSASGAGYGWMQEALLPTGRIPGGWSGVGVLALIVCVKLVATSISASTGATTGVFGPSVVMGGLVGGAFGLAFAELLPDLVTEPSAFVLVGMACFVGGVTCSPISTLVMASEMTGSYELLVPTMLAEVTTFTLIRRARLYRQQVRTRKDSPAHGGEYVLDVLSELRVRDVFEEREVVIVEPSLPLPQLLRQTIDSPQFVFPVSRGADKGGYSGLVTLESVRAFAYDDELGQLAIAADCESPFVTVSIDDPLALALERMAQSHYQQLPVTEPHDANRLVGLITYDDLLGAYTRELALRRKSHEGRPSQLTPPQAPPG